MPDPVALASEPIDYAAAGRRGEGLYSIGDDPEALARLGLTELLADVKVWTFDAFVSPLGSE